MCSLFVLIVFDASRMVVDCDEGFQSQPKCFAAFFLRFSWRGVGYAVFIVPHLFGSSTGTSCVCICVFISRCAGALQLYILKRANVNRHRAENFISLLTSRIKNTQKPATTIKVAASDPPYLGFLPGLDPDVVAAWYEPQVGSSAGAPHLTTAPI